MPRFDTTELITDLKKDVQYTLDRMDILKDEPAEYLCKQPQADKWSIVQVLEHLNAYNRFYLEQIEQAIKNNNRSPVKVFKPGLLGNYFTKLMAPKEGQVVNKMKTKKEFSYSNDLDAKRVVEEFITGQEKLLTMLDDVAMLNLNKIKLPISISNFIKLKLGDVVHFLIAHQRRHFMQIDNIIKAI